MAAVPLIHQNPNSCSGFEPVFSRLGNVENGKPTARKEAFLQECFVGIDVSKSRLDVFLRPGDCSLSFPNDETGRNQLLKAVLERSPELVALEATGGLEIPLAAVLGNANVPLAIVNPRQVRDFAKAL